MTSEGRDLDNERERHLAYLFTAELQFRLASAVRVATTQNVQPLDLPMKWTRGKHCVQYAEIALRQDQADYAACFLHRNATYLMAVAMKDAIKAVTADPKNSTDFRVRAAYQIARLVRNAFALASFSPTWSIDPDCRDNVFMIPDVIELNTKGLHGAPFDGRHYGGPLAIFRLCRFVRFEILHDSATRREPIPIPQNVYVQQGDLILKRVEAVPDDAVPVEVDRLPDGGIPLGGGHVLYPGSAPGKK